VDRLCADVLGNAFGRGTTGKEREPEKGATKDR